MDHEYVTTFQLSLEDMHLIRDALNTAHDENPSDEELFLALRFQTVIEATYLTQVGD